MSKRPIVYYITAHGYGHGVRSCDIIRAFCRLYPDIPVIIVSDLPLEFLKNRMGKATVELRSGSFDVGMTQLDSIRVDVPATFKAVELLYAQRQKIVDEEKIFLRRKNVAVVVSDIPALPLEVAAETGIPCVAVGNFGWDWIYEEFAARDKDWRPYVEAIRAGYRRADLLLRLPFAEPMRAFLRQEDIPLVATAGCERRMELAEYTGARMNKKWALLSFSSLAWNESALARVESLSSYEFFTVKPLAWRRHNIHPVDRNHFPYSDVLASVDVVISKPGFGVLSECVVNQKPLIYADRSDFREYTVLVESMSRYVRNTHIPAFDLYRGELSAALTRMQQSPAPSEKLSSGGDILAARRIAGYYKA